MPANDDRSGPYQHSTTPLDEPTVPTRAIDTLDLGRAGVLIEREVAAKRFAEYEAEIDRLKSERDAAIRELSRVSGRCGRIEGVFTALADRLDYLQELWGREAITDRMAETIRSTLAAGPDDADDAAGTTEEPNP